MPNSFIGFLQDNLMAAGIKPSDTAFYSYQSITDAITAGLGVRTVVYTYGDDLSEVELVGLACMACDSLPVPCTVRTASN